MEKRIIARGLLAGAIGGVLAYLFARAFVEPAIARAIEFEDAQSGPSPEPVGEAELFTRAVQANVGLGFGVIAFAAAMGALFAVAFVVAYGRLGAVSPRVLSIMLAAGAFGAVVLVPWLKYPPNPPAASLDETVHDRTGLYVLMVLLSLLSVVAAVWLGSRLAPRHGGWSATLLGAGAYILVMAIVMLALPTVAETPDDFPPEPLYDFRLYSMGTQLVMWGTIGIVFASSTGRLLSERPEADQEQALTA